MPLKNCFQRLQPLQIYIMLVLSIFYFIVQLIFSHITHALTLLMASYHMLCNILALFGCIITIKHNKSTRPPELVSQTITNSSFDVKDQRRSENKPDVSIPAEEETLAKRERRKQKLMNTFGWTRINILTMLVVFIILASFSFSLLIECLQTLLHIDHQDAIHLPIPVMLLGISGLLLNLLCYIMIGGYSMQQSNFFLVKNGEVVVNQVAASNCSLNKSFTSIAEKANSEKLATPTGNEFLNKRQGFIESFRDISSTIFFMLCSVIVYFAEDDHTGKFIDPVLAIFSCILLLTMSYPYMKESCLILLQTIPGSINMDNFEKDLLKKFPEILNFHDLHIWQLTSSKSVSTIHIKFKSQKLYLMIIEEVNSFFAENGIVHITIQPEFPCSASPPSSTECLVKCIGAECISKTCCKETKSDLTHVICKDKVLPPITSAEIVKSSTEINTSLPPSEENKKCTS